MALLLDTHAFLWFVNDDSRLSANAKSLLESNVDLLLSIASVWEIAIKVGIGKLALPGSFDRFIPHQLALNDIQLLPLQLTHLNQLVTLPLHHRDPFDRLLIAQAMQEQIPIVSIDNAFDAYGVKREW